MVNSHRVTTVSRQAVECEARNPCIHDHNDIKSAEGTTEAFFCRTFGALMFLQSYFAGISHCVLHHLPGNCRPYRTFLRHQVYKSGSEFRVKQCLSLSKAMFSASTSSATSQPTALVLSSKKKNRHEIFRGDSFELKLWILN